MQTAREWVNPMKYLKKYHPTATTDHITYDPNLRRIGAEYAIIRA